MNHFFSSLLFGLLSIGGFSCGDPVENGTNKSNDTVPTVEGQVSEEQEVEIELADADSIVSAELLLTTYPIGSSTKNGYNIGMRLKKGNLPNTSVLTFYRIVRQGGVTQPSVPITDLNDSTIEVFLTSSGYFAVKSYTFNEHFPNPRSFSVSNSVDFKISTAFYGVEGSRYVVGTEDDRNYTARKAAYINILYNKEFVRKVRFSYTSTGSTTGTLKISSEYTAVSIDDLDCQEKYTGIIERNGWGYQYNKCCPHPCE